MLYRRTMKKMLLFIFSCHSLVALTEDQAPAQNDQAPTEQTEVTEKHATVKKCARTCGRGCSWGLDQCGKAFGFVGRKAQEWSTKLKDYCADEKQVKEQ